MCQFLDQSFNPFFWIHQLTWSGIQYVDSSFYPSGNLHFDRVAHGPIYIAHTEQQGASID